MSLSDSVNAALGVFIIIVIFAGLGYATHHPGSKLAQFIKWFSVSESMLLSRWVLWISLACLVPAVGIVVLLSRSLDWLPAVLLLLVGIATWALLFGVCVRCLDRGEHSE